MFEDRDCDVCGEATPHQWMEHTEIDGVIVEEGEWSCSNNFHSKCPHCKRYMHGTVDSGIQAVICYDGKSHEVMVCMDCCHELYTSDGYPKGKA